MTTRQQGIAAIKAHEGLRLQAYPDPASGGEPWTIGWGHTGGVKPGDFITLEQAEQFLAEDIETAQRGIRNLVKVPLTEGQLWALTSFVFNLGVGALAKSTLLRKLNARDYAGAANEFGRWINAAGKPMPGLVRRRAEERAMFLSGGSLNTSPPPAQKTPESEHVKETAMPIPAIVAALLPSLIEQIPKLGKLFGSGSQVAERNVALATTALEIAQEAVGASNAQDTIERMQADPQARAAAVKAVEDRWYELQEAGGGGIDGARKADATVRASGDMLHSPSFWVTLALLPLVYMVVGSVVGLWGGEWPSDVRAAIATAVVSLVVGGAAGYYWGQTTSRNRTPANEG